MPKITPSRAADPHRATRRNHYQEGPGFLFLATQNGRPSGADNRPNLDGVRKRMRAVRRAQEVGIEAAAGEIGVPRRSLYRWSAMQSRIRQDLDPRLGGRPLAVRDRADNPDRD